MRRPSMFLIFPVACLIMAAVLYFVFRKPPQERIVPVPSAQTRAAPTQEECRNYGMKLEAAVRTGDAATANSLLRVEDLARRAIDSVPLSPAGKARELTHLASIPGRWGDILVKRVKDGGKFSLLHATDKGEPRAVFRLVLENEGLDYLQVFIARYPDGQIAADDVYSANFGERQSQVLRKMYLEFASTEGRKSMSDAERLQLQNAEKVFSMMRAFKEGRKKDAYKSFVDLPPELQKDKKNQLLALAASHEVGEREHHEMIERFRKDHPNDPAMDLVTFHYFLDKKQFKEARDAVERMNDSVGGDPYLSYHRGKILAEQGRRADAKTEYEKAIAACPDHDEIVWARIVLAADEKNHDDTRDWLKKSVIKFETSIDRPTLIEVGGFEAFLGSPQYQELLKWDASRGK